MSFFRKWLGSRTEKLAASFLKSKKYKIIQSNYRCPMGEIDLVAQSNDTLVFVEVKSLNEHQDFHPMDHFNLAKQKKLILLAKFYIHVKKINMSTRFDLITVIKKNSSYFIEHFEHVIEQT